ncbi:hypothetical protein M2162_005338 [Streptomyces sp. SAI-041]|nr:hypothetical protein [Streptomyces sp. SAI-041]
MRGTAVEGEDHTGAARGHTASGGTGGDEVGAQTVGDRPHEVVDRHVGERRALHIAARDQVEGDVDGADPVGVRLHGRLVERVHDGDLGVLDVGGHRLQGLPGAADEVDPGALLGEGTGDRAADGSAGAVDDRGLVGEQHGDVSSEGFRV